MTLARVAKVSGRDLDWLVSMYGTVDELLVVILDRVASDGFDDLAPLHLEPSIEGVRSMLEVYSDDRRSAALLRSVLLTGFTISSGAALAAQKLSPITRPESDALSDEEWIAALAIDGWALSTSAAATSCSTTTTSAFPESPCASARPPIPAPHTMILMPQEYQEVDSPLDGSCISGRMTKHLVKVQFCETSARVAGGSSRAGPTVGRSVSRSRRTVLRLRSSDGAILWGIMWQ